jgi:hypothetical protein
MTPHDKNGNGDDLTESAAVRRAASDLDALVTDPGLRFVFHSLEERIQDHADESRAGVAAIAEGQARLAEGQRTLGALVQDCAAVALQASGDAKAARLACERIEATQAAHGVTIAAIATSLGITSSIAPPPMRERLDSIQTELDAAELVAAEARVEAKAAQERAARLESDARETRARAEAAHAEASGAHKVAGEAKLLNAEVVKKLGALVLALGALTGAAYAIAKALGG